MPYTSWDITRAEMIAAKVCRATGEMFAAAIHLGGTLTGEPGIGLAKRDSLSRAFDPLTFEQMLVIKRFFNPNNILNPGKVFVETKRPELVR